ncbi:hypothetical protein POF51_26165 [Brevibacillus sp. AG]|uniref:hypothetical protein n=1 Tax=Brevibacillus sp. AG TaxID=3020891 RepID=UPI00232BC31C|nr:hypothetical protein [Brevibacillus sp. AG]MDC0764209.1 hypothetical protein [Brevibacillus sp. AG]
MRQFALVMLREHFGLYMIYDRKKKLVSNPFTEEFIKKEIGLKIDDVQNLTVTKWSKNMEQLIDDNNEEKYVVIYQWGPTL